MGSAIHSISTGVGSAVQAPFKGIGNAIGGQSGQDVGNFGNTVGDYYRDVYTLGGLFPGENKKPDNPGTPQGLSSLKQQQQDYANHFQKNLPQMQSQMNQQLSDQSNQQMNAQLKQNKQNNSNRGLLYGGVEQGGQQQIRAGAQANLAQGISNSNASLANASQTLNAQALQTGVGIQQNQQMIQNQIYSQQMASMQANNSMLGSAAGMGLLYAMM